MGEHNCDMSPQPGNKHGCFNNVEMWQDFELHWLSVVHVVYGNITREASSNTEAGHKQIEGTEEVVHLK